MSLFAILHVLNITCVMFLALYVRSIQGEKKYSLLLSLLFLIFTFSTIGIKWYFRNKLVLARQMLFAALMTLDVFLIGKLMENMILSKDILVLSIAPVIWLIVALNFWLDHKHHPKDRAL